MITKEHIIAFISKMLAIKENGRYPDIERDSMRYWVLRDMAGGDPDSVDALVDKKLDEILDDDN